MERILEPSLDREILEHISGLYGINNQREGIHLSTLVYCLTRSYFNLTNYTKPTDEEVMLFALGYGLQDVLTPDKAEAPLYELEGITYSPDFQIITGDGKTVEVKTTRMSLNKDLPETWLVYMMGGCHILSINEYYLTVLYMMGNWKPPFPQLRSFKLTFTEEELNSNWLYLLDRKEVLEDAIATGKPPQPFTYCYDWECKHCRLKLQCDALVMPYK